MEDPKEQDIARVLYEVEIATCSIPNEANRAEYWERENQRLYRDSEIHQQAVMRLLNQRAKLAAEIFCLGLKNEQLCKDVRGWQFCTGLFVLVAIIEAIVRLR
jgi:hypothetical protein